MSTHRHFDKICCVILFFTLLLTTLFVHAEQFGVQKTSSDMNYADALFDTSRVHSINIVMDDWDEFTANCKSEQYYNCTVVIDNEVFQNVAIRGKGNTSLSQVTNDRYSYKIEFDHYNSANTYYGLDKLCLNNIIQDNTYMKDYLSYQMMNEMGAASPLCSYAYITVNNEDWGLYLAVEGIEESFLQRNYGKDYGNLYKPDSMNQNMEKDAAKTGEKEQGNRMPPAGKEQNDTENADTNVAPPQDMPENGDTAFTPPHNIPENGDTETRPEFDGQKKDSHMRGSDDVLLKYIDESISSYSNIFDNEVVAATKSDKTRLIQALKKLNSQEDLSETLDIDAVIRYFVVHNFVLNFDSYTGSMIHNYYLYENDGQMQMIPWDYNLAFGGFLSDKDATNLINYPIDSPVSGGDTAERPMIAWIFDNEEYLSLYHTYFKEFLAAYFDNGAFETMMDNVSSMIAPYVQKDPTKFCTYEEYQAGVATLKEFCLLRAQSIEGQLNGTIGATSDTQQTDTFIDGSSINMSSMGSMNHNQPEGRTH